MTTTATITLPAAILIRNVDGKAVSLKTDGLSANVLASILEVGAKTILTNVWNGGGKDRSDAERLAALTRKMDAWARGEFNVTERGDSQMTAMREQFIAERQQQNGMSRAAAEKLIKDTVKEAFGEKEPATFGRFLDAFATIRAKADKADYATLREQIEDKLAERTQAAAAERAKVASKVDLTGISI